VTEDEIFCAAPVPHKEKKFALILKFFIEKKLSKE
jgi:hypothetical protein